MRTITLLPAIDIKDAKAVRPVRGGVDQSIGESNPLAIAREFIASGAAWLHIVDLNAAYENGGNTSVIKKLIAECGGVKIQVSGGISSTAGLTRALALQADRINFASDALGDVNWLKEAFARLGDRAAVSLDVCGEQVQARGTDRKFGSLLRYLEELSAAGCARFTVTDVTRDGNLQGPNLELLRTVAQHTDANITASGGIATLADIAALKEIKGVDAVIVGKALYANRFTLGEALAAAV
ncbi:tRNA-dihydrouridine synthase [Canibacter sp. lx-45]|uniref:HisA/HisF-related TIM barrel protein n=1 Tax=Canibacter zhuwentaonis TaxID=2837491 RepID=UPI001BDC689E|nr:HisA/HisF-related TIM barrel protein [Canibacter zhuwentaonis]MBT1035087.1 tRNA-dihydrouridine synthase [Canibacter zhuwentaonis]